MDGVDTEKSYHHGDLKSELIREGLRILDVEGYDGLTLRKVAKACQVSQTAPYRHFINKDALIGEITLHALRLFNDALQAAVDRNPGDSRMQLLDMGVSYIRFFIGNPEYLRLLFFSNIRDRINKEQLAVWDKEYNNAQQEGHPYNTLDTAVARYKADHPEEGRTQDELVLLCWGFVHGIATLMTSGDLHADAGSVWTVENMIMRGCFLG